MVMIVAVVEKQGLVLSEQGVEDSTKSRLQGYELGSQIMGRSPCLPTLHDPDSWACHSHLKCRQGQGGTWTWRWFLSSPCSWPSQTLPQLAQGTLCGHYGAF